jgi:hypothetical protein
MRLRTLLRLAAFFAGCVVVFALDGVGAGVAMFRMPNHGVFPPAQRDIVHDLVAVPTACGSGFLSYVLLVELAVAAVAFLLNPSGVPIVVAAGISTSLLSALRSVTTWPTVYLNPDPSCVNCGRAGGCPATLWEAVATTIRYYPLKTCGDLMFSGHSMYFIHVALMLHQLSGESALKKTIGWAVAVLCTFSLITCRLHYTADVILAWALSLLSWSFTLTHLLGPVMRWIDKYEPPEQQLR